MVLHGYLRRVVCIFQLQQTLILGGEAAEIKSAQLTTLISLVLALSSTWAATDALNELNTLTMLNGEWVYLPRKCNKAAQPEKGPAAKLLGTYNTAMSFKVIGKGSTVQKNLLPGTGRTSRN